MSFSIKEIYSWNSHYLRRIAIIGGNHHWSRYPEVTLLITEIDMSWTRLSEHVRFVVRNVDRYVRGVWRLNTCVYASRTVTYVHASLNNVSPALRKFQDRIYYRRVNSFPLYVLDHACIYALARSPVNFTARPFNCGFFVEIKIIVLLTQNFFKCQKNMR